MIDRQPKAPDPQPRIPFVSDLLHVIAMTALVWLRSSFGYVFLRPKSVFFAFSWAFILMAFIAWHERAIWPNVRALCIFGTGTVILYWLHLFASWCSELRKVAAHDNYAGTSHALRLMKGAGVTPPENLGTKLYLVAEPAAVLIAAAALRVLFSERYLSSWLFLTAAALCAKEGLNYWFEVRREKRRLQMRDEVEQDSESETELPAGNSVPAKATRKPPQQRQRARASSNADEEERRHAEVLQLPVQFDLETVEQAYRDSIKRTHPDTHGDSAESTRRTAALNEAVEYFRARLGG